MVRAYDQEDWTSNLVVAEYTVTPERTLAAAGIDDAWQAEYQRKPVLGIRLCEIPNHRHDASWRQPCEICEVLYPPRDLVDWICEDPFFDRPRSLQRVRSGSERYQTGTRSRSVEGVTARNGQRIRPSPTCPSSNRRSSSW